MVVREASNATLICKAAGYPEPYVMWRREDGDDINYNGDTGRNAIPYNNNDDNNNSSNNNSNSNNNNNMTIQMQF